MTVTALTFLFATVLLAECLTFAVVVLKIALPKGGD